MRTELKGASLDRGMWKENQVNNNTYPLVIKVHLNTSDGSTVSEIASQHDRTGSTCLWHRTCLYCRRYYVREFSKTMSIGT